MSGLLLYALHTWLLFFGVFPLPPFPLIFVDCARYDVEWFMVLMIVHCCLGE